MNACPKCGDATVLLRWHRDGLDCKRYRAFDSRDPVEETEHLHYHCRTCQ